MPLNKKPNGYWSKARCTEEALKYQSRSEFKLASRSAFSSARRNGWLDEVCSHMVVNKRPNGFWTKNRCAEEALKYQTRADFQKGNNSAYSKAYKGGWIDEICEHMSANTKVRAFSAKENCSKEALKYKSRSEFKRKCSVAYNAARVNGWLDDVCKHMSSSPNWDKKSCMLEALKYESKKAFREGSLPAYNFAYRNGLLDEVCSHMKATRKPKGYWTKVRCTEEALKYQTLNQFEKENPMAVRSARNNGWLNEVCNHMEFIQKPNGYWTKEKCFEEALKYQTRTEFQRGCESAYSKARKNGWLDELCAHMRAVMKPSRYWSKEQCAAEAMKYEKRLDFQKGSESAYCAALKNGWLETICSHMIEIKKAKGYWSKENCLEEALTYETRTDFNIGCNGAYKVALREGWLDEICSHMTPVGNEYLRGLYLIINQKLNKAYIGLTSDFERRKQEHFKGSRTNSSEIINFEGTEFIPLTDYMDVEKAAELELQFVKKYEERGYLLLNDKTRIGGLGGSRLKWTKELCQKEALKYQSRYEFQKKSRRIYAAAQRQGILDDICSHMHTPKRKIYWTKERILEEALQYHSRTAFAKDSAYAYRIAKKNGWIDQVCSHMSKEENNK